MTNRQLHRLKKQWLAEGYKAAMRDSLGKKQINEFAPIIAAAGRALIPVLKWLAVNVLPTLIREYGPQIVEKINKAADKKAESSEGFKKMLYASLKKIPADKLLELTADKLEGTKNSINKELGKANGYVAPSDSEIQKMVDAFKAGNK